MTVFNPLTVNELSNLLEDSYIAYMESGAYYDQDREDFDERYIRELEEKHHFSHMEF